MKERVDGNDVMWPFFFHLALKFIALQFQCVQNNRLYNLGHESERDLGCLKAVKITVRVFGRKYFFRHNCGLGTDFALKNTRRYTDF